MIFVFRVDGRPRPKGSLVCKGGRSHNLVEAVAGSTPWKLHMIREIRKAFCLEPVKDGNRVTGFLRGGEPWQPLEGAIEVQAIFRFMPEGEHSWPIDGESGDLDKLERNLGDALEQSGLIANDRNIVSWTARKRWCYEGEVPGAWVQVSTL